MEQNIEYKRNCPKCKIELIYKKLNTLKLAIKNNNHCLKCGCKNRNMAVYRTDEYRAKQSRPGKTNPMSGKTFYERWVIKYGKDIADQKLIEHKNKQSFNNSGEKNSMYGKPAPPGSGNGWKGWYNKIYFRSLLELAFLHYLFVNKISFSNGEKAKYRIHYIFENNSRTYHPDYIVDNLMYEIKPKKLWNSHLVKIKKEAAEIWCRKNNMEYILVEPERLDNKILIELINNKTVIFTDQYLVKVNNYLKIDN